MLTILLLIGTFVKGLLLMETGKRIALYRKSKRLTQEELAAKLGASRSYLAGVESGKKEPSFNLLMLLIETTDISADWLLTGNGSMVRQSPIHNEDRNKEYIKSWIDLFWGTSDEKLRNWFEMQFEINFPQYREWRKRDQYPLKEESTTHMVHDR